ncbi:MAG: methyl-accepting chemotaxis protein, partial [Caulobacteraceae bacterium]
MCGVLFATTTQLTHAQQLASQSNNAVDFIDLALAAQAQETAAARGYLAVQSPPLLQDLAAAHTRFVDAIANARKSIAGAANLAPLIDDMQTTHDAWRTGVADHFVSLAADPATRGEGLAFFSRPETRAKVSAYTDAAATAAKAVNDWSDDWEAKSSKAAAVIKTVVIVGGLLAAGLSAMLGWLVARAIAKPVVAMTQAMQTLAAGDNSVDIPAIGQTDEVGQMAGAVQMFKTAAIEKIRLAAEAVDVRRASETEREGNERARADSAHRQALVVESVATGLEQLAQGNLVFRLTDAFDPEYEKLRTDFNAAMQTLQETMKTVAGNTATIRSGAGEISSASDDLSRRTEQQAASLEETAAALDQITATVRKTAEGSKHARTVVGSAKTDAEQSGEVVQNAVVAMTGIEQSSQEISQIIGVIDEIAFQTNLLALNAGVEAARAGDAGKGFAVVASEVRALAQRSATAAKEIKTLISTSGQQVKAGVELVGETGKALGRIVAQVTEINGIVAEIAASAQEQATALNEVNSAVNQM